MIGEEDGCECRENRTRREEGATPFQSNKEGRFRLNEGDEIERD